MCVCSNVCDDINNNINIIIINSIIINNINSNVIIQCV